MKRDLDQPFSSGVLEVALFDAPRSCDIGLVDVLCPSAVLISTCGI